jgi:integrase
MQAYAAALDGVSDRPKVHGAGSVGATVLAYLQSAAFHALSPASQRQRRSCLDEFVRDYGGQAIAKLEHRHVKMLLDAKAHMPGSAHVFMSSLSVLMQFARDIGLRPDNPCTGIKRPKLSKDGHRTWTDADIDQFAKRHPIGSKERLALELLICTSQRGGDIVKMGPQHVRPINGERFIDVKQQKTGWEGSIPILPSLAAALAATPSGHLAFLVTEKGKPFSRGYFTRWFRQACKEAGLEPGLTPHGLRKGFCRRAAEAGWSPHEIAAFTGHKTLKEVERYTRAASQRKLALRAVKAMG